MKIKAKTKIHNRFDIEVRDARTNRLKAKGQAENIILNRIYTRLVNFNAYFSRIVFGRGTGTPEPTRTTLFDWIDSRLATTEEFVREFPTSSWTKSIRLEPHEFVGETITEVGISDHATDINTHALIRDAEGNLLSITKTDIDIIIIYATVFIELDDANPNLKFFKYPGKNRLILYLTGNSFSNPRLITGDYSEDSYVEQIGNRLYNRTVTRSSDVENRKATFSTRLGTAESNHDIYEIVLSDLCRANIVNSPMWNPFTIEGLNLGVGDGVTNEFDLKWYDVSNVSIKVNGQVSEEYSLNSVEKSLHREHIPFWKAVDLSTSILNFNIFTGPFCGETMYARSIGTTTAKVDSSFILGKTLEFVVEGEYYISARTASVYLDASYDGEEFTQVYTASDVGSGAGTYTYTINEPYEYLRFRFVGYGNEIGLVHSIKILNNNYQRPKLIFNTPPEEGAIITADYTVPFIPKTEDYVLDVLFEIQFGEG